MLLSISIVSFNNEDVVIRTLRSIKESSIDPDDIKVIVYDNSSSDCTVEKIRECSPDIEIHVNGNIGFGAAHNKAINHINGKSKYHLVLNPDVYFDPQVLQKIISYMDQHQDVGLLMPKILYPKGDLQPLCKLLPTPFDLFARRFFPKMPLSILKKRLDTYEFRHRDYNQTMEVPVLSGVFMFLRQEVFDKVGFFDKRFFLYLEDVDFSRRIQKHFKTVYFPEVKVFHEFKRDSYRHPHGLKHHIVSAIKYFNKWGWFFDAPRHREINRKYL